MCGNNTHSTAGRWAPASSRACPTSNITVSTNDRSLSAWGLVTMSTAHRLALGVGVLAGLGDGRNRRLLPRLHVLQLPLQRTRILLQPPEIVLQTRGRPLLA